VHHFARQRRRRHERTAPTPLGWIGAQLRLIGLAHPGKVTRSGAIR
jgi:hypothetical protein